MKRLLTTLALVTMLPLAAGRALAQSTYGTIEGRIVDDTGSVLPGATVTLTHRKMGIVRTAVSNERGLFRALNVSPGEHDVTVELSGFTKVARERVKVDVGQTIEINFTMKVGNMAETVEVGGQAPVVNTANAEISTTIDTRRVNELPLNGRDFTRLALFVPGAVQSSGLGASISFNGGGLLTNNFLLDGIDATRIDQAYASNGFERGSRLQTASVESIEEFRVLTSNYSAEYGRSGGAVVNAVTKSGGNQFHGSVYGFLRDESLDSRNFFDPQEKPQFDLKQFGGSLGGPIVKDRLFFFNNYEGSRKHLGAAATGTVPSAAFRATVAPALAPILASIPLPTEPGANPSVGLVRYAETTDVTENIYSARLDFKASNRDSLYSRYNVQDSVVDGPLYVVFAASLSGQQQHVPIRTQSFTTSYVRVLLPSLMNEAKFGVNRFASLVEEVDPDSPLPIPSTTITGVTVVPGDRGGARTVNNTSFEYIDNLSWFSGIHNVKAGFNVRRVWSDYAQTKTEGLTFDSLADFAANRPSRVTFSPDIPLTRIRGWNYGFYVQDDMKVTSRVSLNLGLRYEYNPPFTDGDGRVRNFDLATMDLTAPGAQLYRPDRNNFAPRVGATYDLRGDGRTTLRGGYGIYYETYGAGAISNLLVGNAPSATLITRQQTPSLRYPVVSEVGGFSNPPTRRVIDPNREDTYAHQWNVNVQQQLGENTALTVGYVGNLVKNSSGNCCNDRVRPLNLIDPATGRRPDPRYSQIVFEDGTGTAEYHALQVSINRRLSHGVGLSASYSLSSLYDDIAAPQDPTAPWDAEWAVGNRHTPHNFSFNGLVELPFGPGKRWLSGPGAASTILGGWQVNGIVIARSGLPYSVALGATRSGTGWTTSQRPNEVPGVPHVGTISGATGFLNRAAFSDPAAGTYGNLPRNSERGAKFVQVDMSLLKNTRMAGKHNLQLRLEVFNLFNRVQFPNAPTATYLAPATFGQYFNTFGRTEGFGTARQVQLGVRYTF
jgi:outer membrane receptor protein involved in Fe transport